MLQKIKIHLLLSLVIAVTAVFSALFLLGCHSDSSKNKLIPLGTESSIKEILSNDNTRKELERISVQKGFSNLKEWKDSIASQITETELDIYYSKEKAKSTNIPRYSPHSLSQEDILNKRRDIQNRLAWSKLFNASHISYDETDSSNKEFPVTSASYKLRDQFIRESVRNYPSYGSKNPKVIVIEFSDYTCGYCKKAHLVSKKIMEKYKNKVQWVFVDFPLDDPPFEDSPAHLLGNCILSQKKDSALFWRFYNEVFVRKEMSKLKSVIKLGKDLGMSQEMVYSCFQPKESKEKQNPVVEMIYEKQRKAKELGIGATPSYFIGGRKVQGYLPFDKFEKIISQELKQN